MLLQQPVTDLGYPFLLMGMQIIGTIFTGIRGLTGVVDSRQHPSHNWALVRLALAMKKVAINAAILHRKMSRAKFR